MVPERAGQPPQACDSTVKALSTPEGLEHFLGMLDREHDIYAGLCDLSRRQLRVIDDGARVEELLEVLGRKQVLINELEEVECELSGFKEAWRRTREGLSVEARSRVEQSVRSIREVLAELLALEEQGRERLQCRQEEVAAEIRRIVRSRQAHQAYAAVPGIPGARSLIDNQG